MIADVLVTWLAFTLLGPKGVSLPMTIVHAASRDVRLFGVMERTLIRCGCSEHVRYILQTQSFLGCYAMLTANQLVKF